MKVLISMFFIFLSSLTNAAIEQASLSATSEFMLTRPHDGILACQGGNDLIIEVLGPRNPLSNV